MPKSPSEWTLAYAQPVMRDGLEQLVDRVTPGLVTRLAADPSAHDEQIAVLGMVAAEAEELLRDAVVAARLAGRTWGQIADALDLDRAATQARFSAQETTPPGAGEPGSAGGPMAGALVAGGGELVAAPAPHVVTGPSVGERRKISRIKTGKVDELNLIGTYGWRAVSIELTSDWMALDCMVVLEDQQWEHGTSRRKSRPPAGEGWQKVDNAWGTGHYWARPTGKPVRTGNPEPKTIVGG